MRADTIVAYTYRAEILCEVCAVEKVRKGIRHYGPYDWNLPAEEIFDTIAKANGLDRYDETSFDSDDFPKVVFADSVESGERCGGCGEEIPGGEIEFVAG